MSRDSRRAHSRKGKAVSGSTLRRWRLIRAAAKAARRAALEMGPKGVGQAAAYALLDADDEVCAKARMLLVSLQAKGQLRRGIDLGEMDRLVAEHRTIPTDHADKSADSSLLRAG